MLALDRCSSAIRLDEPFAPLPTPPGVDGAQAFDGARVWLLRERGRTLASVPRELGERAVSVPSGAREVIEAVAEAAHSSCASCG